MTEPNLWFPAVFCENLRFSAKICGFLRFPAPSKCWNFQLRKSAVFCENLRFGLSLSLSVTLAPSPQARADLPRTQRGQNLSRCFGLCRTLREKLNRGVSKPGCFPLFSGKVQIVSRTLSGLFLVGALNRPRKRKRTNRENPRTIAEQIGKIPEKSGKSQKGHKRTKKEGQVQICEKLGPLQNRKMPPQAK